MVPLFPDASAQELAPALQSAAATHVFAENQEQVDKLIELLHSCPALGCIVYDEDRGMRHYRQPQLVSHAALLKEGRALLASKAAALQAQGLTRSCGVGWCKVKQGEVCTCIIPIEAPST